MQDKNTAVSAPDATPYSDTGTRISATEENRSVFPMSGGDLKSRLTHHVYALAADSMLGREAGSTAAAEYIARQFREMELEPFSGDSYYMEFDRNGRHYRNVTAVIMGSDPVLRDEYIILGAHFDHLGTTYKMASDTIIYPGADDNASGTAMLIEVARNLKAQQDKLRRSVIIAAFDAEEKGLWGSYYMAGNVDNDKVRLVLNMDMVGWFRESKELKVVGVGMIGEGRNIIKSVEIPEGLNVKLKRFDTMIFTGSDHEPFAIEGIPALYITTGIESPYHEPEDTADKIDYDGMTLIADYMTSFAGDFAASSEIGRSGKTSFKHDHQRIFECGITGSMGSNLHHYPKGALEGKPSFMWSAGLYTQFNIGNFAVRPKVVYEWRRALWPDNADMNAAHEFKTDGLNIPVDIMLKTTGRSSLYGYAFIGVNYSIIFNGSFADTGYRLGEEVRNYERGRQAGAGLNIYKVAVELTFRNGLTPVLASGIAPNIRNQSTSVTISYRF